MGAQLSALFSIYKPGPASLWKGRCRVPTCMFEMTAAFHSSIKRGHCPRRTTPIFNRCSAPNCHSFYSSPHSYRIIEDLAEATRSPP